MPTRIYISGSVQEHNKYAAGLGTEEQHMQAVALRVAALLWENGFEAICNRAPMTLQQVVADSDSLRPDLHVAIHSNAGGGEGTEVYCWPGEPDTRSEKLAKLLYEEVAPLSPGLDRGAKDGRGLLEIRGPIATSALIEVEFHDNPAGAGWIAEHHGDLAQAIARAVCRFYGVPFQSTGQGAAALQTVPARLLVDGQEISGGALLINGKAYVWTRGFAEALGAQVGWDQSTKTVNVTTRAADKPPPPALPMFNRSLTGYNYECITAGPEQLEVAMVRGLIPTNRSGITGGYLDSKLNPLGVVVVAGKVIAGRVMRVPPRPVLWIKGNQAGITVVDKVEELGDVDFAVGAGPFLLPEINSEKGGYQDDIMKLSRPQTALGITAAGQVKLVVTEPASLSTLAAVMAKEGCISAMKLDGGGSQAMVWDGMVIRGNQRAISTAILLREGVS